MHQKQRQIRKAAACLKACLNERRAASGAIFLPEGAWHRARQMARQIDLARTRGWQAAAARVQESLVFELDTLARRLAELRSRLAHEPAPAALSSEGELVREILALDEEFEELSIELDPGTLSVTTEPVVLEGHRLGRFQICLNWRRSLSSPLYRVIALEPNPAAGNSRVTHPHVQDETLCEGEGQAAIQAALDQGRLSDFFLIVSRLLQTYVAGSAYVDLDVWKGEPCQGCGSITDEEQRSYCEGCEDRLCYDCLETCEHCGSGYCAGCIDRCAACDETSCSACLKPCGNCRARVCANCFNQGVCNHCHEQQSLEETNEPAPDCVPVPAAV